MNTKKTLTGLALFSILFFNTFNNLAHAEVKTIRDVLGREVKVDVPIKRGVLAFYYPDYIAVTGAENFKNIIGISREFWEKFNSGSWQLFAQKMPQLNTIADVGNVNTNTFSTEKTISLKPDVLILADWQYQTLKSEIPKLEAAKIPVVVVDFNAQTVEKHTQSAKIFGQLAGTEKRANQIANEYAQGIAQIQKRIDQAKLPKPKIYIEFGDKGAATHSFTFGNNMWGAIANLVRGDNVSAKYVENWGAINPETLLATRPDVILISGTEANHDKDKERMAMGININAQDALRRLATFKTRKGWASLPAVKNNRFYGIYHTASRSLTDLASAQFMAKTLYPQLFSDINPNKTYLDFHKKYLPIIPTGTFYIQSN